MEKISNFPGNLDKNSTFNRFLVGWPFFSPSLAFFSPGGAEEKALKAETEKVLVEKTTAFEERPGWLLRWV